MQHAIVDQDQWLEARRALLQEEKEFQKARDRLAERRRSLPWERVTKSYSFQSEDGPVTLPELFGDRSQLVVQHFMFHPDWEEGCKSCTFWADGFDRMAAHLRARDVAYVAVSRAPLEKLLAYRDRMGWGFRWVSSAGTDFNHDFHVSFSPEELEAGKAFYNYRETGRVGPEMHGLSVFYQADDAQVFHTYSTYSRGLDPFNPAYQILDIVPNGRAEKGNGPPMAWLRRRDEYGRG